jgi:putative NADPH-quinone reductase
MKKILVNLVHPDFNNSIVNKKLLEEIKDLDNITINNLYDKYPDYKINVEEEQSLLLKHDIILFQFPMYWFSSPALLNVWFETVFISGFSHRGNYKLEDKFFAIAISCGAAKQEFCKTGKDKKTVEEFLFPFSITAHYVKMNYLKAFITYETESILSEQTLEKYAKDYVKYIQKIQI